MTAPSDGAGAALPAWLGDAPAVMDALEVSALDAGLRSGWGVFETLRAHGTTTIGRELHLARLIDGAERLGIAIDAEHVRTALLRTLAAPRETREVAARLTLTAGPVDPTAWPTVPVAAPTLVVTLHPAPPLPRPAARAATVSARRWPADIKSTSYVASILATREAQASGADTAILCDGDELLETAEGNLLAIIDGTLVTPEADGRLLPGVTRELVLQEAGRLGLPVRIAPLHRSDVTTAEVVITSSAVSGLRTIARLDGHVLRGADVVHPAVTALRGALDALRR